jgi:adenine-specific DNA-methyltransferase
MGFYELPRRSGEAYLYRLNHPLAEAIIQQAKSRDLSKQEVRFDYGSHDGIISNLEPLIGQSGWLELSLLTVEALDQVEDHLILTAVTDGGVTLEQDQAARLFHLPASVHPPPGMPFCADALQRIGSALQTDRLKIISERNTRFFEAELAKLDGWADDQVATSEKALKDIKKRLRELRNEAGKAPDLAQQARLQAETSETERRQRKLRQEIFDVEDRILAQRDQLVAAIRGKLNPSIQQQVLFTIRWSLLDG